MAELAKDEVASPAPIATVDYYGRQLPDGWTCELRSKVIWEASCAHGEVCKKNNRLLYKKDIREEAVQQLACHYNDPDKHGIEWNEATFGAAAACGRIVNVKLIESK